MDWIELGSRFGVPVLVLAGFGLFGVKYLWPFVEKQYAYLRADLLKQIEDARLDRENFFRLLEEQRLSFLKSFQNRDRVQAKQTELLESIAKSLEKNNKPKMKVKK